MKIIYDENYFCYLSKRLRGALQNSGNYVYLGFLLVASVIIVLEEGWNHFISTALILSTGYTTLSILVELYLISVDKKIVLNSWISYLVMSCILTPLNLSFFNKQQFYWSIASGFIFGIPVLVTIIATKASNWFNKG